MARVEIFAEHSGTVLVEPPLRTSVGPFTTVKLVEDNFVYFISPGTSAARARAFAAKIVEACEAVEAEDRNAVPIASLAPDLPPAA